MALRTDPPKQIARFVTVDGNAPPAGGKVDSFETPDGAQLRYAVWLGRETPRGTVVLVPGRTEFIEKYFETIGELLDRDFAVAAIDLRGQGLSSRERPDRLKGHILDFETYVHDLKLWLEDCVQPDLPGPYSLLAHSMGGHIALRYLHDHPGLMSCAVVTAAMTMIRSQPLSNGFARSLVKIGRRVFGPNATLVSGARANPFVARFEQNKLTHDKARFDRMQSLIHAERDLGLGPPTMGWLNAALRSMDMINQPDYISAIATPLLLGIAAGDQVIDVASQRRFAQHLPNGSSFTVDGSHHEILMETDERRAVFWQHFDRFVDEHLRRETV